MAMSRGSVRSAAFALAFVVGTALTSAFLWMQFGGSNFHNVMHSAWDASVSAFHLGRHTQLIPAGDITTGPNKMNPRYNASEPPRERFFEWTVERANKAPDGVERLMYTINGEFPGPLMEVTEGDTVVVHVRNHIFDNYTVPPPPMSSKLYDVHPLGTDRRFSIHWHGLSMRGMQVMDGSSAFTTCALQPGDEYTYRFVVQPEDVGTHWYHSHVGMSRIDGLWGMLIVHARNDERKVLSERAPSFDTHWDEEIAIAVGDHFHDMGPESLARYVSRWLQKAEPVPENALINGRNVFRCEHSRLSGVPCPAGDVDEVGEYTSFHLRSDKTYRLRLVNVGGLADITFSVDGHTMTVIEADGTIVEPMNAHRIPIAPGQRYSVILHRDPRFKADRAWMRAEMSHECFQYTNPVMEFEGRAVVAYDGRAPAWHDEEHDQLFPLRMRSNRRSVSEYVHSMVGGAVIKLPQTKAWNPNVTDVGIPTEPCHDLEPDTLVPLIPDPAPELRLDLDDKRETVYVTVPILEKYSIVPMGFMNSSTWRPYGQRGRERQPLLHRISYANTTSVDEWNAQNIIDPTHELVASPHPSKPVVYELVINNQDDSPHPFHLHGHKFWVMQTGEIDPNYGGFDYYEDVGQTYPLDRRMKRDTVVVPMMGHAVIRWVADNPGVWPFHCHMMVHLASGMAMAIAELPAVLQAQPPVPRTCTL